MKKLLAILLSVLLLAACVPLGAVSVAAATSGTTEDGLVYEIIDGEVTITGYTDALPADSVIPDTIEGYPVTAIGGEAFSECHKLVSATIPKSVTSIVDYAFNGCKNLTSIKTSEENEWFSSKDGVLFNKHQTTLLRYPEGKTGEYSIPDSVTFIDDLAFADCNISTLSLPHGMPSIEGSVWEGFPFDGCNISVVRVPETTMYIDLWAFSPHPFFEVDSNNPYLCSKDGVLFSKDMSTLLMYPTHKTDVTYRIPEGVTAIEADEIYVYTSAFEDNAYLNSIILPDSITSIKGGTFSLCPNLTSLTFCSSLTMVDFGAFAYSNALTDVYYTGSEEDRANIFIAEWGNDALLNATWHYNYTPEPAVTYGDANGDGRINNKDLGLLQQYLADWDVELNLDACDVNKDGKVNNKDLGLLQQYLADWDVTLG